MAKNLYREFNFPLKALFLTCLLGLTGCLDDSLSDSDSGSSGSSTASVSPKPRVIADGFGEDCGAQTAAQCITANARYPEYVDCVNRENSLPACETLYDQYVEHAELCEYTYERIGC